MAFYKSTILLLCVPLAILLFLEAGTLWCLIKDILDDQSAKWVNYKWMLLGIALFFVIRYLIVKLHWPFRKGTEKANLEAMETFMHERTHQIVALLLGRRLHSFYAEQRSGVVYTSGNDNTHVLVALAPYCLPRITLTYIVARMMIKPEWIWLYDMIIGLSMGFHGVCFYKQTRNTQTDINQFPLYFSYFFIATFLLLNIIIVLVCIGNDYDIVDTICYILKASWKFITCFVN